MMDRDFESDNFKVEYRPGCSNTNADALSHMPIVSAISVPKFELQ